MDNYVERYDKAEPRRLRGRQARKWIALSAECGYEPAGLGPAEHKACEQWLARQYRRRTRGKRAWWRWNDQRGRARWSRERG